MFLFNVYSDFVSQLGLPVSRFGRVGCILAVSEEVDVSLF